MDINNIKNNLYAKLQQDDGDVDIQIKRNSLGWVSLRVVSDQFTGLSFESREQLIEKALSEANLSLTRYPFYDYALVTTEEVQSIKNEIQLPLWSEILMAPKPEPRQWEEDEQLVIPLVVAFYSFKGGVGRTTALEFVAGLLANKRKVVMIDLDLEAPGLSAIHPPENGSESLGVIDYLHQRMLTPDLNVPELRQCIRQIKVEGRGELYLVPAGEYDEGYIHRLADLDMRVLYNLERNPIHQLMEDIKNTFEPDVILLDARTGFDPTSAIALFDLADLAIICFSPTDQSFTGLKWVAQAARKQKDYRGKPDLQFLLTPIPPAESNQQQVWILRAEDWIESEWGTSESVVTKDLYNIIRYNPNIPTLSSFINDVPSDVLDAYRPLFEVVDSNLPDVELARNLLDLPEIRKGILNELDFQTFRAQDLEPAQIPDIFQRTGDFPQFLQDRIWLIRGAKGTGKSLLFRLFVEQPEQAKKQAQPHTNLGNVTFITGHGIRGLRETLVGSDGLRSVEKEAGVQSWQSFWSNYTLLQLCHNIPELHSIPALGDDLVSLAQSDHISQVMLVEWLLKRMQTPLAGPQTADELRTISEWLMKMGRRVWLFYDELDAGFGTTREDHARRQRSLESFLAWILEVVPYLKGISFKILLREDIWNALAFTNKGHYAGHSLQLRWDEEDLWRLILRQALTSSPSISNLLRQQYNMNLDALDLSDLYQLRRSLYPLWGERMGRGRKAYTYNWVRTRITDTQGDRFPRSLVLLLKEAIDGERNFDRPNPYESVLRPRVLIDALPNVSKQRVDEVRNEYPEFQAELDKLRNERSPVAEDRLGQIWGKQDKELTNLITSVIETGILQEYQRPPVADVARYTVAELYLYGLGMMRKGQR